MSSSPRNVLITDASDFVGPAACKRFSDEGDHVVAVDGHFNDASEVASLVTECGPFDVVVANLDVPIRIGAVAELDPGALQEALDRIVHPLFWIFQACLPAMYAAGNGAIVVPTSATAIRSSSHPIAPYETARAAQIQMVQSVGREAARHGVRVNAIAPNYIENPSYFPPETVADPVFQRSVQRSVPAQRLGKGEEAAAVLWWLASDEASYVFGTVVPTDGGWTL